MKNNKILSLVALVLLGTILFSSCSKYEQGPGISLRSKTARVVSTWKISKFIYDGDDETAFFSDITYEFKKDGTFTQSEDGAVLVNGIWAFSDNKEKIDLIDNDIPSDKLTVDIIKLKEKEMKWEWSDDPEIIEMTLTKK